MSEQTPDWTTWIITTLLAGVTTMVGTIVFLAKLIESKYVREVSDLSKALIQTNLDHKAEIQSIIEKHEDCLRKHHEAELRFVRLESQVAVNARNIDHA